MKKYVIAPRFVAMLGMLLLSAMSYGAYLKNVPYLIQQPDGQEINCFVSGDEYYNYLHDANNYTIVKNDATGYYVYADISGDFLVPSPYVVGKVNITLKNIKPGLNITAERWKQLRREFWENTPDKKDLPGYKSTPPKSAGTINNIVVFIQFSDQTGSFTQTSTYYSNMFNNSVSGASSMRNYFLEASYGAMTIQSSFYPAPNGSLVLTYVDPYPRSYYMPYNAATNPNGYNSNQRTSREHTLLVNAVNSIASQVPAGLNIDYNNDNLVDNVCFIIRGGTTAWSTLLWPHRWSLYSQTVYLQGNKRVYDYNFQLETFLDSYSVGVLAHEMFHTLGSPDLYHYTSNGIDPVGSWDVMCSNTNPPQHMTAYMKYKYGNWISSIPLITSSGTYTLNPLTSSTNNCYKINSPGSATEYFVVEFRKKLGTFEGGIPGSGLIIYRINTAVTGNANGPPDELYVYRLNGTSSVNGTLSSAFFSSESGRTAFNSTTNPNCFLTNGSDGGISIYNITSSASGTISFTLGMPAPVVTANFSANATSICPSGTVTFTDQSSGSPTSWSWDFGDGTSSTLQHPAHQYTSTGSYTVSLTASNGTSSNTLVKSNYISASTATVTVNIAASPGVSVCSGTQVSFNATHVNGGTTPLYQWKLNGNNAGTNSATFTHIPLNGDFVACDLTSSVSCPSEPLVSSNTITMSVLSGSVLSQAVFSASPSVVCRNQSGIVFSVNPLAGSLSYVWTIGNGATITSGQGTNSVTVSFGSAAVSGSISVYGVNGCGNGPTASKTYTVASAAPATPGTITGTTNVAVNTTKVYSIAAVANATSYVWTAPLNASIISGQGTTSVTISFAANWAGGNLSVKASNCFGLSASKTIKLRKSKDLASHNEMQSRPGDMIGAESSVFPEGQDKLILYPNPASGSLIVRFSAGGEGNVQLRIFNLVGQVVFLGKYPISQGMNQVEVNVSGLHVGTYFVSVDQDNAAPGRKKLLIAR